MKAQYPKTLLGAAIIVVLSGCGEPPPHMVAVRGRVTYKGQPVASGTVFFCPTSAARNGHTRPATGQLGQDGTYRLSSFGEEDGALPGEYAVAVESFTGGSVDPFNKRTTWLVPQRYADPGQSGLRANVPADARGPLEFNFDLAE